MLTNLNSKLEEAIRKRPKIIISFTAGRLRYMETENEESFQT